VCRRPVTVELELVEAKWTYNFAACSWKVNRPSLSRNVLSLGTLTETEALAERRSLHLPVARLAEQPPH
jgi:hypothetical protein